MSKSQSFSQEQIERRILTVRGYQVMIDRDLAEMYHVETRVLNQAVKRNIERFPDTFRFLLTEDEAHKWSVRTDRSVSLGTHDASSPSRSQNVTLEKSNNRRGQNIKYLPYAFTEQGVAMLSAVLRSEIAVKVSIQIMNAFVEMRKVIANHSVLLQRMDSVERRMLETDQKFEQLFKALENKDAVPSEGVFFDGQVFDAYELTSRIIRSATTSIMLIDNYIDESTIIHLSKKRAGVRVTLLTRTISKQLQLDVQKANEQYGAFKVSIFEPSHDRFLIVDGNEIYHLGASLKDLGKKWFAFSKLTAHSVEGILHEIKMLDQGPRAL